MVIHVVSTDIVGGSLGCHCRNFPMPILAQILTLFQLKIEQKPPKMMNSISNLHFGENAMKIRPKVGKLKMFTSHFDANIQSYATLIVCY